MAAVSRLPLLPAAQAGIIWLGVGSNAAARSLYLGLVMSHMRRAALRVRRRCACAALSLPPAQVFRGTSGIISAPGAVVSAGVFVARTRCGVGPLPDGGSDKILIVGSWKNDRSDVPSE